MDPSTSKMPRDMNHRRRSRYRFAYTCVRCHLSRRHRLRGTISSPLLCTSARRFFSKNGLVHTQHLSIFLGYSMFMYKEKPTAKFQGTTLLAVQAEHIQVIQPRPFRLSRRTLYQIRPNSDRPRSCNCIYNNAHSWLRVSIKLNRRLPDNT